MIKFRFLRCLPLALALSGTTVAQSLLIDLASQSISLLPDTADQQIEIFIQNLDSSPLLADAVTLKFQLDDGLGGNNAPVITSINAVAGTPWSLAGGFQNNQTSGPEYWDVRVFANFLGSQHASLPANDSSLLATLTFDTTGLFGGNWSFQMADLLVDPINTKYELTGGGTFFPEFTTGSVSIIPIPEPATTASAIALGLAVFAGFMRKRQKGQPRNIGKVGR